MVFKKKLRIQDALLAAGVVLLFVGVPIWLFMIGLITGSVPVWLILFVWVWVSYSIIRRFENG